MKYDLEERTIVFAEKIISICKGIPRRPTNVNIIDQLLRSATSIGANYREANGASSRKDFKNRIFICKKESKETQYWIRLLKYANPEVKDRFRQLDQEIKELIFIFAKIISSTK